MIGTTAAILGSAALKAGSSALASSKIGKANKQNLALAQQEAARNEQMIRDNQATNAGLINGVYDQNSGLLTGARDYRTGLFDDAHGANQGLIDQNRAENQTTLDGNTAAITGLLTGIRDQNAGMVWQGLGANDADIRGYSDRAASAINTAKAENQALFQPFVSNGQTASNAINALLGLSGDAAAQADAFKRWTDSTGFQFALDSGRKSIESSQAAEGMLESGATLKALQDRGQQTGQQYFGSYLAALQGQSGQGLSAANSLGSSNSGAAGQLSDLYQNTSGQLVGNRNFATNALVGINDSFAGRQAANIGNYANGTMGISDAYLTNTSGNTNAHAQALAGTYGDWASGMSGLNTARGEALVAGNNGAVSSLMQNSGALSSAQAGYNTGQAQNAAQLFTGIGSLAGDALMSLPKTAPATTPVPILKPAKPVLPKNLLQGVAGMRPLYTEFN